MTDYVLEFQTLSGKTVRILLKGSATGYLLVVHESAIKRMYNELKGKTIADIKLYKCEDHLCEELGDKRGEEKE